MAFHSFATNLDPADLDRILDIYVKNLATGDITLASTSDAGVKGNADSFGSELSADGTTVAFESEARNLDAADRDSRTDIFVKDLSTEDITLASTSDAGVKGNADSLGPALSEDGRAVAFWSFASNLDPADPDSITDIYVKELGEAGVAVSGHGHTDYSEDTGIQGVHVGGLASTGKVLLSGRVRYADSRDDPPGKPSRPFTCKGVPTSVVASGSNAAQIEGTSTCRGLRRAVTFFLGITDNGTNPPNQDDYHMILYDAAGRVLYDWGDLTTVGLGDLLVTVRLSRGGPA